VSANKTVSVSRFFKVTYPENDKNAAVTLEFKVSKWQSEEIPKNFAIVTRFFAWPRNIVTCGAHNFVRNRYSNGKVKPKLDGASTANIMHITVKHTYKPLAQWVSECRRGLGKAVLDKAFTAQERQEHHHCGAAFSLSVLRGMNGKAL
jgi:hypothetical protein